MTTLVLALIVVAVQTATGAVWWRLARGTSVRVLEVLGMGLALGTAAATMSGLLLFSVLPVRIAWAVPSIVTAIALPWVWARHRAVLTSMRPTRWAPALVALVIGGAAGLGSIAINLRNYPLAADSPTTTYHPDMLFFEALSTSLARLGPSDSILMAGAELRYHWFTYAWSGQLAATVGAEPFVVLTRVLPVVSLIGTLLIAIAWTQRMTRGRWAPTLAVVLLVAGGYVGATYGTILNFASPSQAMTTVWMLALTVGALSLLTPRAATRLPLLALAAGVVLLAAATTGGKISSVAVVLAGWGLVAIAATVRHELWWKRAWLGVVSITAAMLVVYLAVVAGSAEQGGLGLGSLLNKASSVQGLNPTNFWWGIIVGTALLGLAIVPRWAGVLWLLADPSSRWRPTTVFSVGAGAASLLALLFFSGGLNDTWFALAASAPLAVTSAVGASRGVMATFPGRGWRPSRPALVTVIAGVVLTAAVAWLWTAGPGASITLRWLGPLVAAGGAIVIGAVAARSIRRRGSYRAGALSLTILAFVTLASLGRILSADAAGFAVQAEGGFSPTEFRPFTPFTTAIDAGPVTAWTPTQARAATWLAANASEGDLTATNITYSPFVPALSAQPMYVAGIQYQAPYGRSSHVTELLTREVASWEFINNPSAESVAPLCAAGVDWVWVDPARTTARTWEPYATIAVDEADAIVLRVNPSAC